MKTILQMAQEIGITQEFNFDFTNEHILAALDMVSISTAYERAVIYKVFGYGYDTPQGLTAEDTLKISFNDARARESITCSSEVYKKLAELKTYGVNLERDEIYSYFDREFPLDYEENSHEVIKAKYPLEIFTSKDFKVLLKNTNAGFNKLNHIKRKYVITSRDLILYPSSFNFQV